MIKNIMILTAGLAWGGAAAEPAPHLAVDAPGQAEAASIFPARGLAVRVNQSGYNEDWPKRLTAPGAREGAEFLITAVGSEQPLYRGKIQQEIGDFTDFRPPNLGQEYVARLRHTAFATPPASAEGEGGAASIAKEGSGWQLSDPFVIAPCWMERVSLESALRFMVDARSVVGTHPSAFGGCPWRDATYYTYEIPSLVLLYLANPGYFENARIEINYAEDKARVLAPEFKLVPATHDQGALEAARRYYQEMDPPVGPSVPDLVQLLHWGIGYYLMKPASHDPSGDAAGLKIHPQTVEQFSFFLYGYPHYQRYFREGFYQQAREFAWRQWAPAGLFNVLTNVGDFKGRECPGHSILPNLLMCEVARREGRLTEAARFLQAALEQTRWVVETLDFRDPRVTKGQRMSEHKLISGLTALLRLHPELAPPGLTAWLSGWADTMIARSDNLWDFRRYDEKHWTLPRFTPGSHGGAGWNEPGNVAAFSGLCWAVAAGLEDQGRAQRLDEMAAAHWDNLFGRNPLGAHAAFRGPRDFRGVERGWPKAFPENVCARLELARGTLNSTCADEHYPFNPSGEFRHAEGWTAFNAAFNVGLAYTCWRDTRLSIWDGEFQESVGSVAAPAWIGISLKAVVGDENTSRTATLTVQSSAGDAEQIRVRATKAGGLELRGRLRLATGAAQAGDGILQVSNGGSLSVSYGHGFLERRVNIRIK